MTDEIRMPKLIKVEQMKKRSLNLPIRIPGRELRWLTPLVLDTPHLSTALPAPTEVAPLALAFEGKPLRRQPAEDHS